MKQLLIALIALAVLSTGTARADSNWLTPEDSCNLWKLAKDSQLQAFAMALADGVTRGEFSQAGYANVRHAGISDDCGKGSVKLEIIISDVNVESQVMLAYNMLRDATRIVASTKRGISGIQRRKAIDRILVIIGEKTTSAMWYDPQLHITLLGKADWAPTKLYIDKSIQNIGDLPVSR